MNAQFTAAVETSERPFGLVGVIKAATRPRIALGLPSRAVHGIRKSSALTMTDIRASVSERCR